MMTIAVLSRTFRRSGPTAVGDGVVDSGEKFLKEVGGLFVSPSSPSHGDSCYDVKKAEVLKRGPAGGVDHNESATLIQAQVRRYLQQSKYRIQQLEQRLQSIQMQRNKSLARIERRKTRKLKKIQRKHDESEAAKALEYQKVAGIIQYLKKDIARCRKEEEHHQVACRLLKTENQRLVMVHETSLQAVQTKKDDIAQLKARKHQLQSISTARKEGIRQFQLHLEMERVQGMVARRQPETSRQPAKAKSYETSIRVNPMDEAEEKCFHYRLVQDLYTLTPGRSG